MKRFKIIHQTIYDFSGMVKLAPHTLRLRPREGHELRIEGSTLEVFPPAQVRWHRDVEGNSVATATFNEITRRLHIKSEVVIQQYDQSPLDFMVSEYAVNYPFDYLDEDRVMLTAYMDAGATGGGSDLMIRWLAGLVTPGQSVQTFTLLQRLNLRIFQSLKYMRREEEGVQAAEQTISLGTGSCRDFANLFVVAARQLGLAARFVSGYIYSNAAVAQVGSTHAWAEVFVPGAGWKGFDPTIGNIVGPDHIAVAVARVPESVPPVAGAFLGPIGTSMSVAVQVMELL